ncbi:CcmD family protein [Polyangium sp. 15x6]|uniref:CcmD family protein n=1 Tax=Polyangium sp. 15x6 TaxID=3042687 RepID=UPI00249CE541|nr:CcmD family protein [Polyangium sp. 15x6]MDI3287713.1 CcmD family protein [Polyangium sp. 15x6]
MSANQAAQQAPGAAGQGTADDRSTTFRAVEGGNQMQSGEKLLVEAYAFIWIVVLVFVASMFRRQRRLDRRVETLEAALQKARAKSGGD